MKKLVIISISLLLSFSCSTGNHSRSRKRESKEIYIYSFRMTYFRKMLLAGFNNSSEIISILEQDHSYYGEPVLTMDDYHFIDSIVALDKAKVTADSAASIGRVAEGTEGKHLFYVVLERYNSKWLHDVAAKRSKSFVNSEY